MHAFRRVLAAAVITSSAWLMGLPLLDVSPAAASTVFRVNTWNTAMGNGKFQNQAHYDAVPWIFVDFANTYRAWQLSLEENCKQRSDVILFTLNSMGFGYSSYFGWASGGVSSCDPYGGLGLGYGNAVMAIGNEIGPNYLAFLRPPGTSEFKNIGCLTMQNIGFKTLNCATHLTPYSEDWATLQMAQARDQANQWSIPWGSYPIVAGDFNITYPPGNNTSAKAEFQNWYLIYAEASLPTWRQTEKYTRMMDYLWARYPTIVQWGQYQCTPEWAYSDHEICPAVFKIF